MGSSGETLRPLGTNAFHVQFFDGLLWNHCTTMLVSLLSFLLTGKALKGELIRPRSQSPPPGSLPCLTGQGH